MASIKNRLTPLKFIFDYDRLFLCRVGTNIFVSPIYGKLEMGYGPYVDDVKSKYCLELKELDELYLIEKS